MKEIYIVFDYVWHLSGVKPIRNCFKSFDSIKEAGKYLISIFERDLDEGIFETLLPEEEMDQVKAAIVELKQDFIVNQTTEFKVELDLSCFEFKLLALCIWPNGAKEVLKTVVEILKEYQGEDLKEQDMICKKAEDMLKTSSSALDREKFDEIFDYMIDHHSYEGAI